MTREQVDKAWLDVARDAGRQDREGEVQYLRSKIARLRAALQQLVDAIDNSPDQLPTFGDMDIARRALEPKP